MDRVSAQREGEREEEHTPKYWWSHSPSLPRTETQCLRCEGNSTCALTFFTGRLVRFPFRKKCVQAGLLSGLEGTPPRYSSSASAAAAVLGSTFIPSRSAIPSSRFEGKRRKCITRKTGDAAFLFRLLGENAMFERVSQLLPVCQSDRRGLFFTSTWGGGDCCCQGCERIPFSDMFLFLSGAGRLVLIHRSPRVVSGGTQCVCCCLEGQTSDGCWTHGGYFLFPLDLNILISVIFSVCRWLYRNPNCWNGGKKMTCSACFYCEKQQD